MVIQESALSAAKQPKLVRDRRVNLRVAPDVIDRIDRAADALRVTRTAFVLDAALGAADRVLAPRDVTVMDAAEFDAMMAALDAAVPHVPPRLAAQAEYPRRFTRA